MKGLCGEHRKVENIPKKTPVYPLTKTESVFHCYMNEDLQSKSKWRANRMVGEARSKKRRSPVRHYRRRGLGCGELPPWFFHASNSKIGGLNERQARELEQRIRPPVEDWLRRTRNTVYLKQQMVVVYVEQYWKESLLLLFWWWPVYKRIGVLKWKDYTL